MTSASHPETDLVHALVDGELPSAEAARVRAHVAGCKTCARELDDAIQFKLVEAGLKAKAGAGAKVVQLRPAAPKAARSWRGAAAGALAASVLLALTVTLLRTQTQAQRTAGQLAAVEQRLETERQKLRDEQQRRERDQAAELQVRAGLERELAELRQPRAGLPVLALNVSRGSGPAPAQTLRLPPGQSWFVLSVDREEPARFDLYRATVTLTGAGGEQRWRGERVQPASKTEVAIAFSTATLPEGDYELLLEGQSKGEGAARPIARHRFRVVQER